MATVLFVEASGAEHRIDVPTGENLMRAALNEGLDGMVGECGGGLACATCHCYVEEDWADRLPAPAQTELDMLECTASERRPSSRRAHCGSASHAALTDVLASHPTRHVG